MINTVLLCLINGILEIAKNNHKYATREREMSSIVVMSFSRPRRLYQALISVPIARLLKKKQTILTGVLSLIMSAKAPLMIRITIPQISGICASENRNLVPKATADDIIKNINDDKETIDIFFIIHLKK